MSKFKTHLASLDKKLDKCLPLILILVLVVFLRVPNFFEPYWYGDEAIYLTVGNGLNQGKVLYKDIMDHKTPIIYYLARVPNQLWFRVLLLGWSLVIISSFYFFIQKLVRSRFVGWLATLVVAMLTTLPWFEGNIPNGELFVLGFVMLGFLLLSKTSLFKYAFDSNATKTKSTGSFLSKLKIHFKQTKPDRLLILAAGFFFGLGLMTKVPALFDFAAALSLVFVGYLAHISYKNFRLKQLWQALPPALGYGLMLTIGFLLPTVLSIIYFYFKGALPDYIHYGLLYNFHYAGTWHHDFGSSFLNFAFTLKGKVVFLALLTLLVIGLKNKISPKFQFALFWSGLTLVASLLSNRPYPHYFIQLIPAFSLLVFLTIDELVYAAKRTKKTSAGAIDIIFGTGLIIITLTALQLLQVKTYSTFDYYQKFFKLMTGNITKQTYDESFNVLVADNNQAAKTIGATQDKEMFIWGTNPMLYALTKTTPPTRFVVLFHIEDVNAYDEVTADVMQNPPRYIVVMNGTRNMPDELGAFVEKHYLPNYQFDHFVLWRKIL